MIPKVLFIQLVNIILKIRVHPTHFLQIQSCKDTNFVIFQKVTLISIIQLFQFVIYAIFLDDTMRKKQ